jgi:uracil-DNA glycosylase family 4
MSVGNIRIELAVRNSDCMQCKLSQEAEGDNRCRTAEGSHTADVLVVSKNPLGQRARKELTTYMERAGFDISRVAFTGATKCVTWETQAGKTEMKACRPYLMDEIKFIKPEWVLCLGNEALYAVTGRSGITKWRGHVFPMANIVEDESFAYDVMSTISPAAVYRNPGQKAGFEADLRFLFNRCYSKNTTSSVVPTPDQYVPVMNKTALKTCVEFLERSTVISIDLETSGFDEFAPDSRIITMAITAQSGEELKVFAIPLWHHESPWRSVWRKVFDIICRVLERTKRKVIAHNGKFDLRWMRHFRSKLKLTFDTMLASHLLNENRPKGLKSLSRELLDAPAWDIAIGNTKDQPWYTLHKLKDILWYNALDTWYTYGLYKIFRKQLIENRRLLKLFTELMVPASNEFVEIERHGMFLDQEQAMTNSSIAKSELRAIETDLMELVPDDHPYVVRYKDGKIKDSGVNFNPSNFSKWWLFNHLELPILARGKAKENGDEGAPSMAEAVMLELRERYSVADKLLQRTGIVKNIQFFTSYLNLVDENSRCHTTFKLTGTSTGRLSSGKADADKVTGTRANAIRGFNAQQVPRDPFVRGVWGAAPGHLFIEADYSQVELRIAAMLAEEPTMLHLYATGQDIHTAMAMRMTGKPWHGGKCDCGGCVTQEERKKAKAVNFGFLYGMGWLKFISTAWLNYGVRVTEEEARAFRVSFFDQFPTLMKWHGRQRRLAHKYGRVSTPMGRVRHLPDITSADEAVRHEAERQAINSPVQGFASDMALWSLVRLSAKFRKRGLKTVPVGAVHDACNFEAPEDELAIVLPMIKDEMENLPLEEVFGVNMTVPIIADLKVGKRWGGAKELTPEQVYQWEGIPA